MEIKIDIKSFKTALHTGPIEFIYTKKDGTTRLAKGTLCESLIPKEPAKLEDADGFAKRAPRKLPEGTVFYYDLEKNGFRSFNESQLVEWFV